MKDFISLLIRYCVRLKILIQTIFFSVTVFRQTTINKIQSTDTFIGLFALYSMLHSSLPNVQLLRSSI